MELPQVFSPMNWATNSHIFKNVSLPVLEFAMYIRMTLTDSPVSVMRLEACTTTTGNLHNLTNPSRFVVPELWFGSEF